MAYRDRKFGREGKPGRGLLMLMAVASLGVPLASRLNAGTRQPDPQGEHGPMRRAPVPQALGTLHSSTGVELGNVVIQPHSDAMQVTVSVHDMPPGTYGVHIHGVGRCDPPDFASAGPHWNPAGTQHGVNNPAGPHAGDLPNLTVGANGRGRLFAHLPGQMSAMLDQDGAALVVHAKADDLKTDPSGNSGARMLCAVLTDPRE